MVVAAAIVNVRIKRLQFFTVVRDRGEGREPHLTMVTSRLMEY